MKLSAEDLVAAFFNYRKWVWAIQLAMGLPCLVTGLYLGRKPALLMYEGQRTMGKVVDVRQISFQRDQNHYSTEYLPIIEFVHEGTSHRFVSTIIAKSDSTGYEVEIIVNPRNPEIAMQNRQVLNWLPWSFFLIIGIILSGAGLRRSVNRF